MRAHVVVLVSAAAVAGSAGCAVVAPPPLLMHQSQSVLRGEPGAVGVGIAAGGGLGGGLDPFAGGLGLVDWQAGGQWKLGVSAGGGARIPSDFEQGENIPAGLFAGRVFGQFRPRSIDWFSADFGLGGGAFVTGAGWGTVDAGVGFGGTYARRVRPYATIACAVAFPIADGPAIRGDPDSIGRTAPTTVYADAGLGLAVLLAKRLEASVEAHGSGGWARSEAILAASFTAGLRYTFGSVR